MPKNELNKVVFIFKLCWPRSLPRFNIRPGVTLVLTDPVCGFIATALNPLPVAVRFRCLGFQGPRALQRVLAAAGWS